jgi:transposase
VGTLCEQIQKVTDDSVQLVWGDQGYTGDNAAQSTQQNGIELHVVKLEEAKKGFVLLPRRWVVERSFTWANRFRRLVKLYERMPQTLKGLHFLAFASLMLKNLIHCLFST